MSALVWGLAVFAFGLALQLALWRLRLPKRQTVALLLIQFGLTLAGCALFPVPGPELTLLGTPAPHTPAQTAHFALVCTALALAWMITWSAVEADSPSLVIMRRVRQAGTAGIAKETLARELDGRVLFEPRLNDLLTDKMAVLSGGKYTLTAKGLRMTRLIMFWRGLMRLGKGG
ncbi:MAG: hypothetical protein PHW69_05285 [Elusimicrobiaceae bacterium]|nr:hypothetical protein [Elusimicrobiaceae bacterium]